MLDGLMSRCTMPCSWAKCSPRSTCTMIVELLLEEQGLAGAHERLQVHSRAGSSMAMKGRPRSSPSSKTVTMFACWSRAAARGLDLEALAALLVEGALHGEGLDRDLALQDLVAAAVDHPHPAPPDATDHARTCRSCGGRAFSGWSAAEHPAHSSKRIRAAR